ncbi:MAG: hypothetical protein JNL10_00845 [Verrucomicrobiales bacterium]|nr:hypothetical protein [Verrucomicrobiales bacterium]
MLPVIEQLLVLQDRDRRRLRLEAELKDVPVQQRRLQDKAAQLAAAAESLKQRTLHLEAERKKLELEVASKQDFIRKCELAQSQTKSNEEYRRYAHQIDTTRQEIHDLEDKEIVLMEQTEVAARELSEAQKVSTAERAAVDRQLSDLAARKGNLERDLTEVGDQRDQLADGVDPQVLSRYDRLLVSRGDNIVVGVSGAICGGCHMKLPQQVFLTAKAQREIVACPMCSRLLYYTRDMEP